MVNLVFSVLLWKWCPEMVLLLLQDRRHGTLLVRTILYSLQPKSKVCFPALKLCLKNIYYTTTWLCKLSVFHNVILTRYTRSKLIISILRANHFSKYYNVCELSVWLKSFMRWVQLQIHTMFFPIYRFGYMSASGLLNFAICDKRSWDSYLRKTIYLWRYPYRNSLGVMW